MASKPAVQQFTQSWDKTVAWAKQNNIPFQAYYPVYQMDTQKMLSSGYGMSEADRINAIQAASGLHATTGLPTDAPNPLNVPGNIGRNLGAIFTGLNPFGAGGGLFGNIIDTVKNTIEHPSSVYGIGFGKPPPGKSSWDWQANVENFQSHVLGQHDILSWIPGFADVAEALGGKQGFKQLADNPITSLLDVLPLGRAVPKALAADERLGPQIAGHLGVTRDELAKMDSIQLSYRLARNVPLGREVTVAGKKITLPGKRQVGAVYDATGNPIDWGPLRLGERVNLFRDNKGMGSDQAEALKGQIIKGEVGTQRLIEKLQPLLKAVNDLSKENKIIAFTAIQKDVRPISDKIADPRYPEPVVNALSVIHDYIQQDAEIKMATGKNQTIMTQFGPETYSTRPGSNGAIVAKARDEADAANNLVDKKSKSFDALNYKVLNADRKMTGAFAVLDQTQNAIFNSIRESEPDLAGISHAAGAGTSDVLWNKIVETQSPLVRNLLGLPKEVTEAARRLFPDLGQGVRLSMHHANALRDLFGPGGLIEKMVKAYNDHDWRALSKYSGAVKRKFDSKVFEHIPVKGDAAFMFKVKQLTEELHSYSIQRDRDIKAMDRAMYGHTDPALIAKGKFRAGSIAALTKRASEKNQNFIDKAIQHPPDVWSNVAQDILVQQILADERSAEIVDKGVEWMGDHGFDPTELAKIRKNPRTLIQLFVRSSKDSLGNGMMPDIDVALMKELQGNMYDELASLRAKGHEPEYIPLASPFDVERLQREGLNIYVGSLRPKSISSTFGRAFEFNSSIYNVVYGLMKDAKEQITHDVEHEYFNEYFSKHLHPVKEINQLVSSYVLSEFSAEAERAAETGLDEKTVDSIMREQIARSGLISYDRDSIFGSGFSVPKLDGEYYIAANMADAVKKGTEKWQFPAEGIMDKGTKLFRFSILQMSPRYVAHILVGGTALIAYRGHLSMLGVSRSGLDFTALRAGAHMFRTGQLPADVLERFPLAGEHATISATQEGVADRAFHAAAGYSMGNKVIAEFMDNHDMASTALNHTIAASKILQTFTRAIIRGQRAVVYLDGALRAEKEGFFTELVPVKQLDEQGNEILHPTTQRPIWKEEEQQVRMSPEQAHKEGMQAVADVMGELRHMTPLERQVFVRMFPFYGWTKHVLTYVLTYPIDHPYRATFLSQLATQNSQDIASGLPTRIQLLTLLGQPDQFGNVSALDTRVFDPLRDTANYASITGLWQSLNPVLSAPAAYVDPQIVFGGNDLYPNVHYSQLYGTNTAGPQGNAYTAAEQFVPELTALDQAFNLSGQYAYLKSQGGNAFTQKIFQSLNVPFFNIQHINLRQIAAKNEMDRFNQAKNDALQAATTGDMSYLSGYAPNSELPDPLNPLYNVTPAYIEAMSKLSFSKYNLPMTATMAPPANPPL